ncbi:PD-(D/E)XK nuclease-like domain-containing protein [Nanchangia anserum]|uniref:PD-(D/E)XK nuclease-like domain-containing protein n=1 Tax=Nanchangia anserum TaxID=2692125 RepID=A0A8I0GH12_9ACTO|nr:PD-(D/E)XK nuclease-like domain-containing protein [Nanchangia anserum]MBD3689854.1 PD-(D/E)XK nuclease-like domain-containing protein [Nanchangia anserum]QOX82020.1 PD-(D/E)XK nuclease-like domain-containing protein [Nanchangia anserum]
MMKRLPIGVHEGIPDTEYHGDSSSLSSSGARLLAQRGGPALFRYRQLHPQPDTTAFRFGRAAHYAMLEDGPGRLTLCPFDSLRTKAAREWVETAPHTWVTAAEQVQIWGMHAAIMQHRLARDLLTAPGRAEVSVIATTPSGARVKARPDYWLDEPDENGRVVLVDYKTTQDATPNGFAKAVATFGYHQAAAWYPMVLTEAGIIASPDDARMVFLVQEKAAPYRCAVYELDPVAIELGRDMNRDALAKWMNCQFFDSWPSLQARETTCPEIVGLPGWYRPDTEDIGGML